MIPAIIVEVESFHLNTNGKVDKKALPDPDFNLAFSTKDITEASTEFEEMISEIWSEVLQIKKVGIHQDFFDLGGDSLSGIRVIARINETFELELPVNLIFTKSTVQQLSIYVEQTITQLLSEIENSSSET